MSRAVGVRQSDLKRAMRALTDAGLFVGSVIVRPGGEIQIMPLTDDTPRRQSEAEANEWDEVLP